MSFAQTVALGALAGLTIYLGLPVGRLQLLGTRARVALAMFSVGVLAFIFVDVLSHGTEILDAALSAVRHHHRSVAYLVWLVVLLGAGFAAGSAGLATVERRIRPLGRRPPIAGGADAVALTGADADSLAIEPVAAPCAPASRSRPRSGSTTSPRDWRSASPLALGRSASRPC